MVAKQHSPGFLKLAEAARAKIVECSAEEVKARLERGDKFVLIDVREDHEWQDGRIVGAEHLGRGILERDIEERYPNTDTDIVLYCGGGYRSAMAAEVLLRLGYRCVRSLAGGWRGWLEKGFPTQRN